MLDLLNSTCVQLYDDNGDVHLRGQLSGTFNSLLVSLTFATSMAFGPGPGQATCHLMTSSLMTHQRSDCNQTVCSVPTACRYTGIKSISTAPILWEYDFICACGQAWCNELLLWLRPNSVHGSLKSFELCEVGVGFPWFERVVLTSSFSDNEACSRWINPPGADTVCRPPFCFPMGGAYIELLWGHVSSQFIGTELIPVHAQVNKLISGRCCTPERRAFKFTLTVIWLFLVF